MWGREHQKTPGVVRGSICEHAGPRRGEGVAESRVGRSGDIPHQNRKDTE